MRIFCRCSSTNAGIEESKLRVYRMLNRAAVLTVAELVELQFGLVEVDRRFAAVAVDKLFVQRALGL